MDTDAHFDVINNRNLAQFYAACCTENMAIVEFALQKKFPVNSTVKSSSTEYLGDTALHLAVKATKGSRFEPFNRIIEKLFSYGADVTISNAATNSAIHTAFKMRSYELVRTLFSGHGYNRLNVTDQHGLSHFHIACYANQNNLVENFLKHGVAINNKYGQCSKHLYPSQCVCSALHFVLDLSCSVETVTLLMKYKADVNIKNQVGLNPLRSLLECQADFKSNTASAMLLLGDYHEDCIGDVELFKLFNLCQNKDFKKLNSVLRLQPKMIRASVSNDSPQWPGCTLLHFAATFGIVGIVDFLLQYASWDVVNATNSKKLTPLHCLLKLYENKNDESNHVSIMLQIAKLLVYRGASIEFEDLSGFTPIDYAFTLAKQFKTETFIQKFVDTIRLPKLSNDEKLNMLCIACLEADYNYVEQLGNNDQLKKLVNMTTHSSLRYDLQDYTPLHYAVYGGDEKIVEILLNNEADFCAQNAKGLSPLHLAERSNKSQIVDLILKYHSKKIINPVDQDGLSHLHIACKRSRFHEKIVLSFVESNLDINGIVTKNIEDIHGYDKLYTKGDTLLHVVAKSSSLEKNLIELLLDRGADYTLRNADGATPQHLFFTSNTHILDYILSGKKELLNLMDNDGWSYLYIACELGKTDIVKKFLQEDNNVLSEDNNVDEETPLHAAVRSGCLQIVEMLVAHGAKVHAKNKYQRRTPLHYALKIRADHEHKNEIISCLLSKLNIEENKPVDETGLTLLHIAAILNDTKTIERLLKLGLDVNSAINFNSPMWPGFTSLHLAVWLQCTDAIKLLLDTGADWELKTKSGIFPFGFTARKIAREAEMDASCSFFHDTLENLPRNVLFAIFQSKALPHIIHTPVWYHCSTFHIFCHLGSPQVIKAMLKLCTNDVNNSVDFFSDQYPGYTALHFAVDSGCIESVTSLINHGANLNAEDAFGCTPVHLACMQPSLEILKLLILKGAYINGRVIKLPSKFSRFSRSEYGLATPLHVCGLLEKWDFFRFLLNNGADISLKNSKGKTAHLAIFNVDNLTKQSLFWHFHILIFFNFNNDDQSDYLFCYYDRSMLDNVRNECEKLLEDKTYIDNFTSLSDLITANPIKMHQLKKQTNLQQILSSDEFNKKYPNCGFILKLQFQRGLEYKLALWDTMYSINPFVEHLNSTLLPLPELCIEKILENLDKDDLANLIEISNSIILNRTWLQ